MYLMFLFRFFLLCFSLLDKAEFQQINFAIGTRMEPAWMEKIKNNEKPLSLYSKVIFNDKINCFNFYEMLERNYNKYVEHLANNKNAAQKIPQIIHHIWIGAEMPPELKLFRKSWIKKHPTWECKLWGNDDIHQILQGYEDVFNALQSYREKSDLLRYLILKKFGGVYVDSDFRCLKPLDELLPGVDFLGLMHTIEGGYVGLANGFIACVPNHPILNFCVKHVRKTVFQDETVKKIMGSGICAIGPIYITKAFYLNLLKRTERHDFIIAPNYLLPISILDVYEYFKGGPNPFVNFIPKESYAIHYWNGLGFPEGWKGPKSLLDGVDFSDLQ